MPTRWWYSNFISFPKHFSLLPNPSKFLNPTPFLPLLYKNSGHLLKLCSRAAFSRICSQSPSNTHAFDLHPGGKTQASQQYKPTFQSGPATDKMSYLNWSLMSQIMKSNSWDWLRKKQKNLARSAPEITAPSIHPSTPCMICCLVICLALRCRPLEGISLCGFLNVRSLASPKQQP